MTLILAIDCADGMVLASDSQATFGAVRQNWPKLYVQHDNLTWGGAGHAGIIQLVRDQLLASQSRNAFNALTPSAARIRIGEVVARIVRPQLTGRRIAERPDDLSQYLFVGHSSRGSFILVFDENLMDTDYIGTGYAAIGSGGAYPLLALAGLEHYKVRTRTLREAKLIAFRVMEDAINAASQGLGMPIQMTEITKPASGHGQARSLTDPELSELSTAVLQWKAIEADSLTQFMGIQISTP